MLRRLVSRITGTPMKLKCQNCAYEWNYRGQSEHYATCPRCLRKVKVEVHDG